MALLRNESQGCLKWVESTVVNETNLLWGEAQRLSNRFPLFSTYDTHKLKKIICVTLNKWRMQKRFYPTKWSIVLDNWNWKKDHKVLWIRTTSALVFTVTMVRVCCCGTRWDKNTNPVVICRQILLLKLLSDTGYTKPTTQINCKVSYIGNRDISDIKKFRHPRT